MSRKSLSLPKKTTIAQEDRCNLRSKLVGYVMHLQRLTMIGNYPPNCIIAMDKTAAWSGMVGNTTANATGEKDIPLE